MIRSIKIKEVDDPLLDKVKGTYKASFPPCERRKFEEVSPRFLPSALSRRRSQDRIARNGIWGEGSSEQI